MKKIIFPLLLLATTFATAQPSIQWQKTYGGSFATNDIRAVDLTTDGGYILAGSVSSNYQALLVKLDALGNTVWKKNYGGTKTDKFYSVQQTSDGGYIAAGNTNSNDGDVSGLHNASGTILDIWVVKLDATGNITWQKCIGGSKYDGYNGAYIKQTADGYIIASSSNSIDGDITGNHGMEDAVVIKLNNTGDIVWQKSYGGTQADQAYAVQQTKEGGYIVAVASASNDGDVSGHHGTGYNDYWILKLDATGNITWEKSLGGTSVDLPTSIQQTTDNGYIISGKSLSVDGDVTGNHGGYDYWVVKTNSSGTIVWQKSLGGSAEDDGFAVQQTSEGGYIVCGYSVSNDGNVSGHNLPLYSPDAWVVKLTEGGNITWQKCVGGTKVDYAYDIKETAGSFAMVGSSVSPGFMSADYWLVKFDDIGNTIFQVTTGASEGNDIGYSSVQTIDGGYIMAGYSSSSNGDVTDAHGGYDCWVVKTNSSGNIEWQKSYGGSGNDSVVSIIQTRDGGYIFAGQTLSNDGDVSGNHGLNDGWVVKLDASGNITWQNTLGGTGEEFFRNIVQTSDDGYIMEGSTSSNDGDVTGNHGHFDYWVVKLDATGNLTWQKCLGGSNDDEGYVIRQTREGGYIVGGKTSSNDGDVTGNHGGTDYWIVKLDATGNITWKKIMGGTGEDRIRDIKQTPDDGYIIAGFTTSSDGDVSGNHGDYDYWIVKTDAVGNITWQKCFGGSSTDHGESIQQTSDGGYVVGGYAYSTDGDVTGNHGKSDYWVIKLNNLGDLLWQKSLGGSKNDYAYSLWIAGDGGILISGYTGSNDGDVTNNHQTNIYDDVFDYWMVKLNPSEALPVTLLSFNAIKQQNDVLTQWQTTSEMNVSHFELQRSVNGVDFIYMANINAANSSSINNYRFIDVNVLSNNTGKQYYYRLKMIDKDGQFTYSNVAVINISTVNSIKIYPNPSIDFIQIDGVPEGVSIEIHDAGGKLIKRILSNASYRYSVSDLRKGMYFIKILDRGNTTISKLIIQ